MSAHNHAQKGQIAKTVLMPGDPLRAKFIAETFLENAKQFNDVRGMLGFTGTYKGKEVSVMGSGMGMPSIGIYSYELYNEYDVENIIRIGSAGAYTDELDVKDLVLVSSAYSESTFAKTQGGCQDEILEPTASLNDKIEQAAQNLGIKVLKSRIHSSDVFYRQNSDYQKDVIAKGCTCVEMESFALFHNAKVLNKNAACLLTISDSFVSKKELTAQERQDGFKEMMKLALEAAITL